MRRPLLSHGTKPDGKRANRLTMKLLPPGFVIFSTRAAKHDLPPARQNMTFCIAKGKLLGRRRRLFASRNTVFCLFYPHGL